MGLGATESRWSTSAGVHIYGREIEQGIMSEKHEVTNLEECRPPYPNTHQTLRKSTEIEMHSAVKRRTFTFDLTQ